MKKESECNASQKKQVTRQLASYWNAADHFGVQQYYYLNIKDYFSKFYDINYNCYHSINNQLQQSKCIVANGQNNLFKTQANQKTTNRAQKT